MRVRYVIEYQDSDGKWHEDYYPEEENEHENPVMLELKKEAEVRIEQMDKIFPALKHRALPVIVDEWLAGEITENEL